MKSVNKILSYQRAIQRVLSHNTKTGPELETVCMGSIGHEACFESFLHALKDLIASGHIQKVDQNLFLTL